MPKLIGIATHAQAKGPITQHQSIQVTLKSGLKNDYRGQCHPLYQVTLMSAQTWNTVCQKLGTPLDWTARRANLLVDNMDFSQGEELIGQQIQIGKILLEITAETDPCSRMNEHHPNLKQALTLNWFGGVRCKVLKEGTIQIGDRIHLLKRI